MATRDDVASYILQHFNSQISTMKLQKLAYFSQGWSLALRDKPIAEDMTFQAWINGPVCRELYEMHRGEYSVGSWPSGNARALSPQERVVIDAVLRNYGGLSGGQLSDLSHSRGAPWQVARDRHGVRDGMRTQVEIDFDDMKHHFKTILGVRTPVGV